MPNEQSKSRYHAEVKVVMASREVRLNIFADSLQDIYRDLALVINADPAAVAQAAGAQPPIISSKPAPAAKPAKPAGPPPTDPEPGELPTCAQCGEWDGMELIHFTDKKTGQPRQAFKCQSCNKWHYDNAK